MVKEDYKCDIWAKIICLTDPFLMLRLSFTEQSHALNPSDVKLNQNKKVNLSHQGYDLEEILICSEEYGKVEIKDRRA